MLITSKMDSISIDKLSTETSCKNCHDYITSILHNLHNVDKNRENCIQFLETNCSCEDYEINEKIIKELLDYYNIPINRCLCCNADLGESNPRQFCMKTYCPYE